MATIIFILPAKAEAASLLDLLRRKKTVQQQQAQTQQKLQETKQHVVSLQENLKELANDIGATQRRLVSTQSKIQSANQDIERLDKEVADAEGQIQSLEAKTRQAYIFIYEYMTTETVVSLTGGEKISDQITRKQYLEAIQTRLSQDTEQMKQLKTTLVAKKEQQTKWRDELRQSEEALQSDRAVLAQQQSQQRNVLASSQDAQQQYETSLKKLAAEHENLDQAIYELRRRQASTETVGGRTSSSYPYASEPNPSAADPWLFIKRQCVSYTAWKWLAVYGKTFRNTRPGSGSAWNWPALARDQGYRTSSSPRANSVVSWPIGPGRPYGHVAWVESVNADGTINVSEYNWLVPRGYGERRNVNARAYGTPTYIYP